MDYNLQDSGDRSEFGYGAMRDRGEDKGRFDLLPASAIARLAKHFSKGAKKYADRNWEKGMPLHMFMDSGLRHAFQYLDGDTSEDHLVAAAWNFMCAMWTEEHFPELVDIPTRPEFKQNENRASVKAIKELMESKFEPRIIDSSEVPSFEISPMSELEGMTTRLPYYGTRTRPLVVCDRITDNTPKLWTIKETNHD